MKNGWHGRRLEILLYVRAISGWGGIGWGEINEAAL